MSETTHRSHQLNGVQHPHALSPAKNFMIRDLDTGVASTLHNTSWIDKGFDPIDLTTPSNPNVRRKRSNKPPLHPVNPDDKMNSRVIGKETKTSRSRLKRKNSRRSNADGTKHMNGVASQPAVKVDSHRKKEKDFASLVLKQEVKAHNGAVRALAFSQDGMYLATAGQDAVVNVYLVHGSETKAPKRGKRLGEPTSSSSMHSTTDSQGTGSSDGSGTGSQALSSVSATPDKENIQEYLVGKTPLRRFHGHSQDVVDLAWSKNGFLLSASMDMTVILWHPDASLCLRKFVHKSFVTSVTFHPNDENIFISGSLDGAVRLWHVTDQKLLSITQTGQFITASAISHDGKTALIGTYHGHCKFYSLYDEIANEWSLKFTTQLDVRSRRAKNHIGKKIAGFSFLPKGDKFVVSSNDSRIRVYRMDDKGLIAKFSGHENNSSQLKASVSPCGKYLLCGSQDSSVVIWDLNSSVGAVGAGSDCEDSSESANAGAAHKERNASYEKFTPFDHGTVSAALFAPRSMKNKRKNATLTPDQKDLGNVKFSPAHGAVIVAASQHGSLRIFENTMR